MSKNSLILSRKELEKIVDIVSQFNDVDRFEITEKRKSGIGSILTLTFESELNSTKGEFSVEISGVESW